MKHYLSLLIGAALIATSGCTIPDPLYKSEKENQLTEKEERSYVIKARVYAKQNYRAYRLAKNEVSELDTAKPEIRSYCEAYKYGDISVAWSLKSGKVVTVKSRGYLLDNDTKMSIKIMRVINQTGKGGSLTLEEYMKNLKK